MVTKKTDTKKVKATETEKPTKAAPKKKAAVSAEAKEPSKAAKAAKAMEDGAPGIRIRLSAFDYRVLDEAAAKILETAERSGAVVHGPIPLPTKIRKFTVNKSFFVHKNARDQYEMRIHRRLIDLTETTFKTVESLQSLSLPSGVDIEIKMR
jgi:small subunit ribosomal protein S10